MSVPAIISSLDDYDNCGDYKVRCYNIAYLEDEIIDKFTSDFKSVAYFFKQKRLYGDLFSPNNDEIKHIEAFLDLLGVFTKDSEYKELADTLLDKQKRGQVITMCEVKEAWKMNGANTLFDIIKEIAEGHEDKELLNKGYTAELIKKAHDTIALTAPLGK